MDKMKTVVVGDILIQDNQERKFASDPQYAVLWTTFNEKSFPLILTQEELGIAIARGVDNPEDVPELGSETSVNEFDNE